MLTITIQIGNSDNKLTQQEWCLFVDSVRRLVESNASNIHFFGGPPTWEEWQNAAWVVQFDDDVVRDAFKKHLRALREMYKQDSVAWTEGDTVFI